MTALRIAAGLILAVAALAPWFLGAPSTRPWIPWIAVGALGGAFMLVAVAAPRRVFRPGWTNFLVAVLLGCLAVFAVRGEPAFATTFSRELVADLTAKEPGSFIALPWTQRLAFLAACLLGLVATAHLSVSRRFRRTLLRTLGLTGLAVAVYSLAQRAFGVPLVPWALIHGVPERFNASFFHYSAIAACLNLAWPLLVFGAGRFGRLPPGGQLGVTGLILAVTGAALVPLGASAGVAVAVGLLVLGSVGALLGTFTRHVGKAMLVGMVGALVAIALWQRHEVQAVVRDFPDRWQGREITALTVGERDAKLEALSRRRGDRIIPSEAPARASLWLTGWRMANEASWIGPGPATWTQRSALYSNDSLVNTFAHGRQFAHHDPLQAVAEWGWLGFAAWAGLWGFAGRRAIGLRALRYPSLGAGLALFGVVVHSTVDFPLACPAIQVWAALLLGCAVMVPRLNAKKPGRGTGLSRTSTERRRLRSGEPRK